MKAIIRVMFVLIIVVSVSSAQTGTNPGTGFPAFGSFAGSEFDTVNEGKLNVHFEIPIVQKSGRGLSLVGRLAYDSLIWSAVPGPRDANGNPLSPAYFWPTAVPVTPYGWYYMPVIGYVSYTWSETPPVCPNHDTITLRDNYTYHDPSGTAHSIGSQQAVVRDCDGVGHGFGPALARDASGFTITVDSAMRVSVVSVDGTLIHPSQNGGGIGDFPGLVTDTNGNQISYDPPTGGDTDTLGVVALKFVPNSGGASITYPSPTNPANFVGVTLNYSNYQVRSNFGCAYITDYYIAQTAPLVNSVVMPDNSAYTFTYEQVPGGTNGRIASVTLPSGGTIRYQYTGGSGGIICADASTAGLIRTTPDGLWTYTRTVTQTPAGNGYSGTVTSSVTRVSDLLGNVKVINFGINDTYESKRQVYSGSTLLETIETCYNGAAFPCTSTPVNPEFMARKTVQKEFPDTTGKVAKTDTYLSNRGLVTDVYEYDYGPGSPGPLLSHTATLYATLSANIFYDPNDPNTSFPVTIYNRPQTVTVTDAANQTQSQTSYFYDETAVSSTSGTPQHVAVTGSRGNVTTIKRLVQGTSTVQKTKSYFDTGMINSETDFKNNPTTYVYGTASCGNSFPTTGTDPLQMTVVTTWDCNGAVATSVTDRNNKVTSYTYGDPNFWRLTQTDYPDGGRTTSTYNLGTASPWNIIRNTKISSTQTITQKTIYDGLARVLHQQLTSDPEGTDYIDTVYDAAGHVGSVSNPYRSTADSTYGRTSYTYDGLGRVKVQTQPDGSTVQTTYAANCTTVTDQAAKQRKSCKDILGRLTQVIEDPTTGGLNYETDYQYNTMGDLICAVQKGNDTSAFTNCASALATWRPRSFTYDLMSRLVSATNPESGSISYSYDANGNLVQKTSPKANQSNPATSTNINFCYDPLNRVTSKAYNTTACPPASSAATYTYDQGTNGKGRRTGMTDVVGSATWTYDLMGRVASETRVTSNVTKTTSYTYNQDGSLQSITYPSTRSVNYTYNAAGHALSAIDPTGPINYVTAATYTPPGTLATDIDGFVSGSFAGITTANIYNSRLQPCRLSARTTGSAPSQCSDSASIGNVLDLKYDFHAGSGDNGNVFQIANNRDNNRTQNFVYDNLNRIQQAWTNGPNWGETFGPVATNPGVPPSTPGIDAWSNLTQRSGVLTKTVYEPLACPTNNLNQLTTCSLGYDAAGNTTSRGTDAYTYDSENRITKFVGATTNNYSYDGDGQRVKKTGPVALYWYGATGEVLDETTSVGALTSEYIFFNGKRVARVDLPGGTVRYYFSDHLGTASVVTDNLGVIKEESDYYPYGGEIVITDSDPNRYKFTGKERDTESGLDNFGARYYGSSLGRFMSTDPIFMELHRLEDPQQLNLYSYVRNNPESLTDPSGELIDILCTKVSSAQCSQTVSDLNNRKGAQFQVTRDDKTGQLNAVGKVDPSKLSKSEAELYKAITDTSQTATLQVVPFSASVLGDQFVKPGLNIVDRADLTQFGKANSALPGEIIAHAAVEGFESLSQNLDYAGAHNFANQFFGNISVGDLVSLPRGAATATSGQATYNFQRVGVSVNVQKIFVTPQPAGSVNTNFERIKGNIVVSTSDKK